MNACNAHYDSHSALTSGKKKEGESSAVTIRNHSMSGAMTPPPERSIRPETIDDKFNWFPGRSET